MFGFLKRDPVEKLRREYMKKMKEARDLQRSGKIPELARKTAEAEVIRLQMEALEKERGVSP